MKYLLLFALAASAHASLALVEKWPSGGYVCIDAPLKLTFDHPPTPGAAVKIEVCRAADGTSVDTIDLAHPETLTISGNTACIRLRPGSLVYGASYLVRVSNGAFKDAAGAEFAGVAEGWNFQTKAPLPRNLHRLTVSADGASDFCTVQGAVDQVEPYRDETTVIFIRKGRYEELVRIGRARPHVHLVGEDRKETVIAATNNDRLHPGWLPRSVLGVEGDDFSLENLTVRNTTPYHGSQAEAVYIGAERCVLRNADLLSFQDTLNLSGRVYVADCYIEGDVDYVWGYGTACFERCELHTMHDGYIVQARNSSTRGGYLFLDCKLTVAPGATKCYLARIELARFPASQVTFIRCQMAPPLAGVGWLLNGPSSDNLRFEEFASTDLDGKPLDVSHRNPASKQLTAGQEASRILEGKDSWTP